MSDLLPDLSSLSSTDLQEAKLTPLADSLQQPGSAYCGALTISHFGDPQAELRTLAQGTALHDLGWLSRISVRGSDRIRWLNGMLTNTIQGLAERTGNYNFVLNAQGRIQGDAYAFRFPDELVLETTADQVARLMAHLDHFIIMDDVELAPIEGMTTLGLSGPAVPELLVRLGVERAFAEEKQGIAVLDTSLETGPVKIVRSHRAEVPRFEIWFPAEDLSALWTALIQAGATPVGTYALETMRILEGTPLYGVDIHDRDLPQETNQPRALNFSKGCYLGQEIVERIRSRATVHRQFGQFLLEGSMPSLPCDLTAAGQRAGQITSATEVAGKLYALAFCRVEARERKQTLEYEGGTATWLEAPPNVSTLPGGASQPAAGTN